MKSLSKTFFLLLFIALGAIPACSGGGGADDVDPDEAFLQDVRERAVGAPDPFVESGTLNPGNRNPKIELETTAFDMGEIEYEGLAHAQMEVYNRGKGDLQISKITTTCGCTTAKMPQNVIKPGESSLLEITVDPTLIAGYSTTKTLSIASNDPANPIVNVDVTTHIKPLVDLQPNDIQIGILPRGVGKDVEIRVTQLLDEDLLVDSAVVYPDSRYFTADYEEVPEDEWQDPGRREYRVSASMTANTPPGTYIKTIMIHTNLPHQPNVAVPFELIVAQ